MKSEVEERRGAPIARKVGAGVVLVVAAWLAIHFVFGLIATVFYFVLTIAVIVAILWALKTIFW
jgi:fatty acid desaturase